MSTTSSETDGATTAWQPADWWQQVTTVALFGTARREPPSPPPALPVRPDATAEEALLDAAALGSLLIRAGTRAAVDPDPSFHPAPPDSRRAPAPRARQLLELILSQSPTGPRLQALLLRHWLQAAVDTGHRIPYRMLPTVIEIAGRDRDLRPLARAAGDARARWLGGQRGDWEWLVSDLAATTDPRDWARQPTAARVETVRRLRRTAPDTARELIRSALPTDGAQDRQALLGCLEINLGPADEGLLEQCLDDRSRLVRDTAAALLDGLPESARAGRMAARLTPLLSLQGVISTSLSIKLPTEPDDAGIRDGLGRPRTRRSERGYWLERLAAGAPLSVWTKITGADPARAWSMITDQDARHGIVQALVRRRDQEWAAAIAPLIDDTPPYDVLPYQVLPTEAWDQIAARRIVTLPNLQRVSTMIRSVSTPWGPAFSAAVLDVLARLNGRLADLLEQLALGLHPSSLGRLNDLATGSGDYASREGARNLAQYLTLSSEIAEAFR